MYVYILEEWEKFFNFFFFFFFSFAGIRFSLVVCFILHDVNERDGDDIGYWILTLIQ